MKLAKKNRKAFTLIEVIVVLGILLIVFFMITGGLGGCNNQENARRILEQQGYTNVHMTGYRPWMKGEDDTYSDGFEAVSPSGHRVTGSVTSGWGKGSTIRLD